MCTTTDALYDLRSWAKLEESTECIIEGRTIGGAGVLNLVSF
jgi:hypothetical protein